MSLCQKCIDSIKELWCDYEGEECGRPKPVPPSECTFWAHKELREMLQWFQSYNWIQIKGEDTYQTPKKKATGATLILKTEEIDY